MWRARMSSLPLINPVGSRATCLTVFCLDIGNPTSFGHKPESGFRDFLNLTIRQHSNFLNFNIAIRSETLSLSECRAIDEWQL